MKEGANQTLWSSVINADDGRRKKKKRDAERALYPSMRKLLMEHSENDDDGVRAAKTQATMDVWRSWLAALLPLDEKAVYLCSILSTGGRLLLTGSAAEAQT